MQRARNRHLISTRKRLQLTLNLLLWAASCTQSHGGADDLPPDAGAPWRDLALPPRPVPDLGPLPDLMSPSLALLAVTPPVGPPSGGIALRLDGQGFVNGATVSIDGQTATPVQFMSGTQLATTLPQDLDGFGAVPVTVTLPSGATVTRNDLFAYAAQKLQLDAQDISGAINPTATTVGDFDSDGQDDFAITSFYAAPRVLVWMNKGTRVPASAAQATYAGLPVGVALGDFDGDGHTDVVVSTIESVSPSERQLHTFFGDGATTLSAEVATPQSSNVYNMIAAELSGDNNLDLLASCDNSSCLLVGDGHGRFGSRLLVSPGGATTAAVADLDGDGIKDFAIANAASSQIFVFWNDGKGGLTQQVVSDSQSSSAIAIGDVDRDGIPDLMTSHKTAGTLSLIRGLGGRNFATATAVTVGGQPECLHLADFNGDLALDAVVSDSTAHAVNVLLGNGKGGFAAPVASVEPLGPYDMVVGDFDHDRRPDVLALELGSMSEQLLLLNHSR